MKVETTLLIFVGSTILRRKDISQKRYKTDNKIEKDKSPKPNPNHNPKPNPNTYSIPVFWLFC